MIECDLSLLTYSISYKTFINKKCLLLTCRYSTVQLSIKYNQPGLGMENSVI